MASRAPRTEATICMSGSSSTQRLIMARTTNASSTTITRRRSRSRTEGTAGEVMAIVIFRSSTSGDPPRSDQSDFLELRLDDLLVERLHDVFIGSRVQRAGDVRDVVLAGAEHDFRAIPVRHPAQHAQELVPVHPGHVPVEQHGIRHLTAAGFRRPLAVLGFRDLEFQAFENATRHFADHARIINDQAVFHHILAYVALKLHFGFRGVTRGFAHAARALGPKSSTRSRSSTTMSLSLSR